MLLAYARLIPGIIILGLIAALVVVSHQRDSWHHQFDAEHAGRIADRAAYTQAQKDAEAKNKAHVVAKEAESKRITDETQSAYARDHAELIRLRQQARAAQGAASGASPSPSPAPTEGADADGLRLSADEHLQASEIELRLMHLQNWIEQQLKVDPNK